MAYQPPTLAAYCTRLRCESGGSAEDSGPSLKNRLGRNCGPISSSYESSALTPFGIEGFVQYAGCPHIFRWKV
jgi:hypothetical protein